MKKLILISALLLPFIGLHSQVKSKKAEEILESVSKKIKGYQTMKIEFTYIMENKSEKIKESKQGSIYIEGDKYRLYIADQLVISDGNTMWTYFKEGNEVQINDVDPKDENSPLKILTAYYENYRAKFIREMPKGGKTIQVIDLIPNKPQSFFKIRLEIDKADKKIVSSTIYDKNGTTFTYEIERFHENPRIHPSRFAFNRSEYQGVIVTDMR